jgi:hypothetical protein
VIGHERQASRNLFGIIRRFYDLLPEEMRLPLDVSNQDELVFSKLDSGYLVSVASSEGTGRSATAQLLHASEVAFWDDLPQQMAGLMQTVPETPDTEVILESTPRGWNSFHSLWRKAETGESEFVPVYLPWFIDPNYRKEVGPDFQIDEEEAKLAELYGLDRGQIAWRGAKIAQLDSPDVSNYCDCRSLAERIASQNTSVHSRSPHGHIQERGGLEHLPLRRISPSCRN